MSRGIDGTVEIVEELDRISETSRTASEAPRSKALYKYLSDGMTSPTKLGGSSQDDFEQLTELLFSRLSIWWSASAYRTMPVMTPWCVRDRSCRYDQGPESWGAPRADGYLRDDNSIIKKLPLPVAVRADPGHPYHGQKPWRGFTACHIWRDLGDGIAGEDPWLYSFMPNLVWVPSWLAALTDRHGSRVQGMLQRESYRRFRDALVDPAVAGYAEYAWSKLPPAPGGPPLDPAPSAEFEPEAPFFVRRLKSLTNVVDGCESVAATGTTTKKLICSRYTAGLPALAPHAVVAFATEMRQYRDAAWAAVAAMHASA